MKLDRFVAKLASLGRAEARRLIATGQVRVNGAPCCNTHHEIDRFMRVELQDHLLQQPARGLYILLHKPAGWLSATQDHRHPTVLDLIDDPDRHTLHIAGRLDRATTGFLLLTNDGRWSKNLMSSANKVPKVYLVETAEPIAPASVKAFAKGFRFHPENIVTLPAGLEILASHQARVTLHEGRHHQIKRMFRSVGNRVVRLHRERIGSLALPADLHPGQWRPLTKDEMRAVTDDAEPFLQAHAVTASHQPSAAPSARG